MWRHQHKPLAEGVSGKEEGVGKCLGSLAVGQAAPQIRCFYSHTETLVFAGM